MIDLAMAAAPGACRGGLPDGAAAVAQRRCRLLSALFCAVASQPADMTRTISRNRRASHTRFHRAAVAGCFNWIADVVHDDDDDAVLRAGPAAAQVTTRRALKYDNIGLSGHVE